MSNPLLSYLNSAKNYAGLGLGAAAAGATLWTGAGGPLWPVIVGAAYGIGAMVAPAKKKVIDDLALDGVYDVERLREAVDENRAMAPSELKQPVETICVALGDILDRWDSVQTQPNAAHDVASTIVDYLPTTLRSYLRVPAHLRREQLNGSTPFDSVQRQLEVLREYVIAARQAAYADDMRQLEQQGAFLNEKWRKSSLDLG